VTIEEHIACIDDSVRSGDTVTYDPGEFEEPPADLDYSIIYEDEWLFAVNKPAICLFTVQAERSGTILCISFVLSTNPLTLQLTAFIDLTGIPQEWCL
jgi:23S rRNA-/tRNA-specific pseudouridylate synthase